MQTPRSLADIFRHHTFGKESCHYEWACGICTLILMSPRLNPQADKTGRYEGDLRVTKRMYCHGCLTRDTWLQYEWSVPSPGGAFEYLGFSEVSTCIPQEYHPSWPQVSGLHTEAFTFLKTHTGKLLRLFVSFQGLKKPFHYSSRNRSLCGWIWTATFLGCLQWPRAKQWQQPRLSVYHTQTAFAQAL